MKYSKKAELHCHSKSNRLWYFPLVYDSVQTVEEIINRVEEEGISILAITDHDSLEGYRKAISIIKKRRLDILVVSGCEISTRDGHILAYGIRIEIPAKLSGMETVNRIHEQGGIAVAAHPFFCFGVGNNLKNLAVDAVEGRNTAIFEKANKKAINYAKKRNLPWICGSDAHVPSMVGDGETIFSGKIRSEKQVLEAIAAGDFKVQYKKMDMGKAIFEYLRKSLRLVL